MNRHSISQEQKDEMLSLIQERSESKESPRSSDVRASDGNPLDNKQSQEEQQS